MGLYVRHGSSLEHDPREHLAEHPDTPERIVAIERELATRDWLGFEVLEAPIVSDAVLERVHSPTHVEAIRELAATGGGPIDEDTFVGEASFRAAQYAAGGACQMVERLLNGPQRVGFSGARPAGHHAERARAMGFCLFNNVAVAAQSAIAEHGLERVFVLDWDVHHGNGTAEIFRRRTDVLFASIHQTGLYPGTGLLTDTGSGLGEGYTINLPVYEGSEGGAWLSLLEWIIVPAALDFRPQLVLISAGFDAHRLDPIGGCLLETEDFAQMTCHVRDLAATLGAPVGAVLEGGYDLAALPSCVIATLAALSGVGDAESIAPDPILTRRAAAQFGRYWRL
ncbi:MAG TPA: histone deacetylase [Solirubrobacteraceae bacterium]|jgi:acetoin utilization deacetylase AcuC-like enzyme|nr:histone deacetylase [Solirubrobacteraceae bacterium]